jgi:hypothetical protein
MTHCASCGADGPFCAFSPGLGGVVCSACWSGPRVAPKEGAEAVDSGLTGPGAWTSGPSFALSQGAIATLQVLIDKPLVELESFDIDARAAAEVEHVLAQTLAYHGH